MAVESVFGSFLLAAAEDEALKKMTKSKIAAAGRIDFRVCSRTIPPFHV
jgi:hypothetical protein